MDDREFFELEDGRLTTFQLAFLAPLRALVDGRLRPYCTEFDDDTLLLVLDVDAPEVALVNVGLELRGNQLRGDRISVHDRAFPPAPTGDGFVLEGDPGDLATRGAKLLDYYIRRPVVKYEWLHDGGCTRPAMCLRTPVSAWPTCTEATGRRPGSRQS